MSESTLRRRTIPRLLVALVVLAVGTAGLAAACPPAGPAPSHCPLMSAQLCSGPSAAVASQSSALDREPGNCCRGSQAPAKTPGAFLPLLEWTPVPAALLATAPAPAIPLESWSPATPSPRPALYTLFRSLLI